MRRALLLAVLVAGCSMLPGQAPRPPLGVSNGTTLAVTLIVNGQPVGVFPAAASGPTIDVSTLPPLPWHVEARSPTGRVLTRMDVEPGAVFTTAVPGGAVQHSGTMGRVDLSCGRLTIWAGDVQPGGPPPPSPAGAPGDCEP